MSRGAGNVQRNLIATFQGEPGRRFKVVELAEIAFPGEPIEHKHEVSVRRALRNLPGLKLHFQRTGESGTRGWALPRAALGISIASNAGSCRLVQGNGFADTRHNDPSVMP